MLVYPNLVRTLPSDWTPLNWGIYVVKVFIRLLYLSNRLVTGWFSGFSDSSDTDAAPALVFLVPIIPLACRALTTCGLLAKLMSPSSPRSSSSILLALTTVSCSTSVRATWSISNPHFSISITKSILGLSMSRYSSVLGSLSHNA